MRPGRSSAIGKRPSRTSASSRSRADLLGGHHGAKPATGGDAGFTSAPGQAGHRGRRRSARPAVPRRRRGQLRLGRRLLRAAVEPRRPSRGRRVDPMAGPGRPEHRFGRRCRDRCPGQRHSLSSADREGDSARRVTSDAARRARRAGGPGRAGRRHGPPGGRRGGPRGDLGLRAVSSPRSPRRAEGGEGRPPRALATGSGASRQRLGLIDPDARAVLLAGLRAELQELPPDDYLWEGEVICAVGSKPGTRGGEPEMATRQSPGRWRQREVQEADGLPAGSDRAVRPGR